jgi:hypothetical protein
VSTFALKKFFTAVGIRPQKLRIDRLLDEAHYTADPVHLMRAFGISATTAIKYVKAAHPERFTVDPMAP